MTFPAFIGVEAQARLIATSLSGDARGHMRDFLAHAIIPANAAISILRDEREGGPNVQGAIVLSESAVARLGLLLTAIDEVKS